MAARTYKAAHSGPMIATVPSLFTAECGFSLFVALRGITTRLLSYHCIVEQLILEMVTYIKALITHEALDQAVIVQEADPQKIQHRDYNSALDAFWKRVRAISPEYPTLQ